MFKSLISAFLASSFSSMQPSFVPTQQPYRSGTPSKRVRGEKTTRADKLEYDEARISQDMRRYAQRYRNAGARRKQYPFSAKRG